jgi:nucleolin
MEPPQASTTQLQEFDNTSITQDIEQKSQIETVASSTDSNFIENAKPQESENNENNPCVTRNENDNNNSALQGDIGTADNKKRPLEEGEEDSASVSSPPNKKSRIEEQEADSNSTLFLGNLPSDITEGMLTEIFSKVGTVKSVKLNKHKDTGKVKGYGFLELATPEEAHRAVKELHGTQVLGKNIKVEISIPKHLKPPKWKQPSYYPFSSTKPKLPPKPPKGSSVPAPGQETNVVFVGNLSDEVTERDIRELFRRCGPIKEIRWLEDKKTGKFRGCGFVEFYETTAAYEAIKLNGVRLFGRAVHIDASTPKPHSTSSPFGPEETFGDRYVSSRHSSMAISRSGYYDTPPPSQSSLVASSAPPPSSLSSAPLLSPSVMTSTGISTDPTASTAQALSLNAQALQALTAVLSQNALLSGGAGTGGLPLLSLPSNNAVSGQVSSLVGSNALQGLPGLQNLQNLQGFQQVLSGLLLSNPTNLPTTSPNSFVASATPSAPATMNPPMMASSSSFSAPSTSLHRGYGHEYSEHRYHDDPKRRSGWDTESQLRSGPHSGTSESRPPLGKEHYAAQAARTVFIGNIRPSVTDEMIKQLFRDCGRIVAIRWLYDKQTNRFKGCGFVEFESEEAAVRALRVKAVMEGREIYIDSATNSRSSALAASKSSSDVDKTKFVYKREQPIAEQQPYAQSERGALNNQSYPTMS